MKPVLNFEITYLAWNGKQLIPNLTLKDYNLPEYPVIFAHNPRKCLGVKLISSLRKFIAYKEGEQFIVKPQEGDISYNPPLPCECINCQPLKNSPE